MSKPHPPVRHAEGDVLSGIRLRRVTPLPEVRAVAYEGVHEKSGARFLHLHSDDREKMQAIGFRTPPPDDTGLPHILEHTVLCGSRSYPVKDPFVELLKTSLATFLNAFTYPDRTIYPCASMVRTDFFNLARVYCDAVFHPLISETHFKQEGHHFDFETPGDPTSPLTIKGVVYNEMKGVFSDLDGIMDRWFTSTLCPDNAYGRESGGDPDAIPTLTYADFCRFHAQYYHPANAFILCYGDIPTEDHAAFLEEACLGGFDRIEIDTGIPPQPRWDAPRRATVAYPIGPSEPETRKTAVALVFLANDVTDAVGSLCMSLLDNYLLGNAASPLRQALIDSDLGDEITGGGYHSYQRDTFYGVGLKGTDPENAEAIEALVLETCRREVEGGLDREKVEAALQALEVASLEIGGGYPIQLMDRVFHSWIYEADPLHLLRVREHIAEIRRCWESEPGFFENRLRETIVENPHRACLTFVPDREYFSKRETAFREKMAAFRETLSEEELAHMAAEAVQLEEDQARPNSPEDLATLPRVSREDIPAEPVLLDTALEEVQGRPFLVTNAFANGVNYLDLAFDLRGMDDELFDDLPLFTEALRKMGAAGEDYLSLAEREAASTGGIHMSLNITGHNRDRDWIQPFLVMTVKGSDAKIDGMLDVFLDRVFRADFDDTERLRRVILQKRATLRGDVAANGWQAAVNHASRHLSANGRLVARTGGVAQVRRFDHYADNWQTEREAIVERLQRIRETLRNRGRVTGSFVGTDGLVGRVRDRLGEELSALREEEPPEMPSAFTPTLGVREAIAAPSDIAFVALRFRGPGQRSPEAPAILVLANHLTFGYLWEEVRVKGGAYGIRATYSGLNGDLGMASYRDPQIKRTLDTYLAVPEYVAERMDLSPEAVGQAVVGTMKLIDRPIRPSQAAGTALGRFLSGETPEFRREFRQKILAVTGDDIRRVAADVFGGALPDAPVCVLASREKLEAENLRFGDAPLTIEDL